MMHTSTPTASHRAHERRASRNTLAIILAGGSGTRLKSLTRWHSKPAIPFGGKFRTIDFALSNCINSEIRKISILTQYKSHSLNAHIAKGWGFLRPELGEFIDCIPAQQRVRDCWYQGTADAVYQNLDIIQEHQPDFVLVLAGDHVYKMDYREMIRHHVDSGADMTIACLEVPVEEANQFGVMNVDANYWVKGFVEKPSQPESIPGKPGKALASLGIYVFSTKFLYRQLQEDAHIETSSHDFGKDIIPHSLRSARLSAYPFRDRDTGKPGYWRDVGTIDAYFDANLDLTRVTPQMNLYDESWPIWTYQEQLPPAKFVFNDKNRRGMAVDSMISGGCIVSGAYVENSLLSNKVRVNSYAWLSHCVILPDVEIGRHCVLRNCIIEQGCKLPSHTTIGIDPAHDAKRFFVSPGGVVLVSKDALEQALSHVA
jgi:glucose-1-phosphate adenylyltransferase